MPDATPTTEQPTMHHSRALLQGTTERAVTFLASTAGVKRDGLDLDPKRFLLDNYRANPVFLWAHDWTRMPIGIGTPRLTDNGLELDVTFDQDDDFAREVERKYRDGFLRAVSIGWQTVMRGAERMYDLMEVSAVPVPADPAALARLARSAQVDLARELLAQLDLDDLGVLQDDTDDAPPAPPAPPAAPDAYDAVRRAVQAGLDTTEREYDRSPLRSELITTLPPSAVGDYLRAAVADAWQQTE